MRELHRLVSLVTILIAGTNVFRRTTEVRFVNYGVDSFEIIDNGSGIREQDYDTVGM